MVDFLQEEDVVIQEEDIVTVFSSILTNLDNDRNKKFNGVLDSKIINEIHEKIECGDYKDFYHSVVYPLDNFVDHILDAKSAKGYELKFLFKNSSFVQRHFRAVITRYEGILCSADKTNFILGSLVNFYLKDKKIILDRTQKYTFQLPIKVFTDHYQIINFFQAVHQLYYAHSELFIASLNDIHTSVESKV